MAGAVVAGRYAVPAALILGIEPYPVRDAATVDFQRRAIDVFQSVGGLVIVGIKRLIGVAAPPLGLRDGLVLLGAGEDAARGDTGQGEAAVVGAAFEVDVFRRLSGTFR